MGEDSSLRNTSSSDSRFNDSNSLLFKLNELANATSANALSNNSTNQHGEIAEGNGTSRSVCDTDSARPSHSHGHSICDTKDSYKYKYSYSNKDSYSSYSYNACKDMDVETESTYRAVHQIRLPALIHNYNLVEAAAAQQMCNVIVVVKADGYGHGAIRTALHMADKGADAFAVATLEEAILLRKALDDTFKKRKQSSFSASTGSTTITTAAARKQSLATDFELSDMFRPPTQQQQPAIDETDAISVALSTTSVSVSTTSSISNGATPRRAAVIRILVLGPPVGCPLCFDEYCHYSIECMVSGPEVAAALMQWVANPLDHKRRLVERVAQETKEEIGDSKYQDDDCEAVFLTVKNSATLSGITGKDLVKEYKQFVLNQKKAAHFNPNASNKTNSQVASQLSSAETGKMSPDEEQHQHQHPKHGGFSGIEAAASMSRNREKAAATRPWHAAAASEGDQSSNVARNQTSGTNPLANLKTVHSKNRRLRWHAVVDTGMGRLGFKTEYPSSTSERRDTVEILQELVDAQLHHGAPLGKSDLAVAYIALFTTCNVPMSHTTYILRILRDVHSHG